MKLLNILIIFTVFLLESCIVRQNNCKRVHTGEFLYHWKSENVDFLITRDKTRQIDKNLSNGETIVSEIKWVSDCEFEIKVLEDHTILNDTIKRVMNQSIFKGKILSVNKEFYTYEIQMNESRKLIDTVKFIR